MANNEDVNININVETQQATNNLKSAQNAVFNFNQVIRDTPSFANGAQQGIMAISNNIGPMVDSLRIATAEAGSFKGALAGMVSSMMGPMGIITAISVGVSIITIYGKEIGNLITKMTDLSTAQEKMAQATVEATADAKVSAAASIAVLQAEVNILKDTNESYAVRKRALDDIHKSGHLQDIKDVNDAYKITKERIDDISKSIVAQATIEAYKKKITESVEARIQLEDERAEKVKKLTEAEIQYSRALKASANEARYGRGDAAAFAAVQTNSDVLQLKKDIADIDSQLLNSKKTEIGLNDKIKEQVEIIYKEIGGGKSNGEDAAKKAAELLKKQTDDQLQGIRNAFNIKRNTILEQYNQGLIDEKTYRQGLIDIQTDEDIVVNSFLEDNYKKLQLTSNQKIELQNEENKKLQDLIKQFNDWKNSEADKQKNKEKAAEEEKKRARDKEYQDSIKNANDYWDQQKAIIEGQARDEHWSKEKLALELLKLQKSRNEQLLGIQKDYGERTGKQEEAIAKDNIDIDKAKWDDLASNMLKGIAKIKDVLKIAGEINGAILNLDEARINKINDNLDSSLSANDKAMKSELIAQKDSVDQKLKNDNLSEQERTRIKEQGENDRAKIEYKYELNKYNLQKAAVEARNKIAEREFKVQKALNLANAIVEGAEMVIKSINSGGGVLSPAGIAGGVLAAAITTANVAKILSTKFKPEGSPEAPSFNLPNPNINSGIGAGQLMGVGTQQRLAPPEFKYQKVYVTQTDIRKTINKVEVAENRATLK